MNRKTDFPSSSFAPTSFPKLTYDVFISFRGTDTRKNFTDHLYSALKQKGIVTFRDDEELERGESIAPSLLKAIEASRYVIVVFSRNYAESSWCLDEIAKVADCMKTMGQKVLPVFYHVDPSEVRIQTGDHFREAFEKHQKQFKEEPDKVKRWKDALFEVGNLSGWHLKDGYESQVIQEVVEKIFCELNQMISISEGLVGMDSHLNEMLLYLDIGCPDVRIIGICGMGGIGKSTIAYEVSKRIRALFEGDSFLENVREVTEKQGAVHLQQQQLLLNLLNTNVHVQTSDMGKDIIRHRVCRKRVLLVLDDVDQEEQLDVLCNRTWFGPGSRIILTSRDEQLLTAFGVDKIYKVNPLTAAEALDLFHMKAFKKDQLIGEDFLKLSREFMKYANGLPLAIKVLASSVHGRSVKLWSSALGRLKNNPQKKIIDVLKVSFDGLEETEKKIFLDIACFFKGEFIDHVTSVLKGSDYSPDIDIEVLVEKSLVTLFGRKLGMHDLIQELGWEIVRQESREEPGKRSRLWHHNEIMHVLCQSKATSAVQSILLQSPTEDDVVHSIDKAFSNMDRLRLLRIQNVKFSGNIRYLSNELQYLEWHDCPLDSFPSDFQPDKLVEGWRMLRLLDLTGSQYLMSTPDFTEVPDLEKLVLQDCTSLVEIHPSLGLLKKLVFLNMKNCKSIESLPTFTSLESLQILSLSLCSGLKKFPDIEGNMKSLLKLHLDGTGFEELPPSIGRLTGLALLGLTDCEKLLYLPNTIGCLTSLKYLFLEGCSKLDKIPNLNGIMKCLETLCVGGTSVRELSFVLGLTNLLILSCRGCKRLASESCKGLASLTSLIWLDLSYCNLMDGEILSDLSSLISLRNLDLSGNFFVQLPESISRFSKLETLFLSKCRELQLLPKKLPLSLRDVIARYCTSLTDYPNQIEVLTSWESGAMTTVNSLDSASSALEEISRSYFYPVEGEGVFDLRLIHKYTDGNKVYHYMPRTYVSETEEMHGMLSTLPTDEIPEWFDTISTRNSISIPIPQNLDDDSNWKGFAACAIFSLKGHTTLSVIEPDPDFSNYSYQIALETDVVRLKPQVWKAGHKDSSFGSSSHLLIISCTSNLAFQKIDLDESSVVRAIFETSNPSMVVQKCAIRLVYEQDVGWCSRLLNGNGSICLNDVEDASEFAWLSESWKWDKFIPPLEEESTLVLRKNLQSVLPRYLEAINCSSYAVYRFNLRGSPGWFQTFIPDSRSRLKVEAGELPQNLHMRKKWMGIAIFASLVEEVGQTMKEDYYRVFVALTTDHQPAPNIVLDVLVPYLRPWSEEHHQLLVIYIPQALFTRTSPTAMDFYISTMDSPHVNVQRCGYRVVYQEDIQGFADTLIWCMQREDSLARYNKLVVENWIQLIRLGDGQLKRMTKRDSRAPREKYIELQSQKYKNWDWSHDSRSFFCGFERAEISKWKWFMPFINQGNYAEIQLPLKVFDDDRWLGFAVCSWLSHEQCPNSSLGSADLDSEGPRLQVRLHSDVDWNGLFDCTLETVLLELNLTWFYYIPCAAVFRKMWRQCKLAKVTMWFTNPCFAVHSCALRLVFKEDVEDLVETLTLAELH